MKITVKTKREVKEEKITIDDIEPGTVFKYGNGVVGLKLFEKVALLKFSSGEDWFEISDGTMNYHGIEILGRLNEIIVVEE